MLKPRAILAVLLFITFIGVGLYRGRRGATASQPKELSPLRTVGQNQFVALWHSQITYRSGERVSDGDINITAASPANTDRVSVWHSLRGGPFTGYTMPDPDRIEIQMSLGSGRVAHYNGVLVSADRVEGRYFVTGDQQNHHIRKRPTSNPGTASLDEDEGTWVVTKP